MWHANKKSLSSSMYDITLLTFILGPVPQQNSLTFLEKLFILRLVHSMNFTLRVITWVEFQCCFLQLFVISIEERSQSTLFGTYILASVTFLLSLVLCQSLLYGSCVFLLEHLYSHSSYWNSWSFSLFWWTFMISEQMYLQIFLFTIFVFTLGTPMLVLSLNLNLNMVLPQGTNR